MAQNKMCIDLLSSIDDVPQLCDFEEPNEQNTCIITDGTNISDMKEHLYIKYKCDVDKIYEYTINEYNVFDIFQESGRGDIIHSIECDIDYFIISDNNIISNSKIPTYAMNQSCIRLITKNDLPMPKFITIIFMAIKNSQLCATLCNKNWKIYEGLKFLETNGTVTVSSTKNCINVPRFLEYIREITPVYSDSGSGGGGSSNVCLQIGGAVIDENFNGLCGIIIPMTLLLFHSVSLYSVPGNMSYTISYDLTYMPEFSLYEQIYKNRTLYIRDGMALYK